MSKLSQFLALGVFLFSTIAMAARTETTEQGLLRSAILLRLDRTEATNTESSDRGSDLVIADINRVVERYAVAVSSLGNGARPEEIEMVKAMLADIFALIPRNDVAFERVIKSQSATAPKLVAGLRSAIKRSLNISATRAPLRVHALDLLHEQMRLHEGFAAGPFGPQFLSTFSIWLAEVTGWRHTDRANAANALNNKSSVTPEEHGRILRSETEYRKGYRAMLCARLFVSNVRAKSGR
jgi:hypothetical protein